MSKTLMTRTAWTAKQLASVPNVLSAAAIFGILMYSFLHGYEPFMIAVFFAVFFLVTAWHMLAMMLVFSLLATAICMVFPFLAPIAFLIMVGLFIARISFVLNNWRAVLAGLCVYGLALMLYFRFSWLGVLYLPVSQGIRYLFQLLPASLLQMLASPTIFLQCLILTSLAGLITFGYQMLLFWLYRHGYSTGRALSIMGSIPLIIIAMILPFLKAAAADGMIGGDMADGFAHDGAVGHDGFVKTPDGYQHVNGYTRIAPDGHTEYVHDYVRTNPDGVVENNLSYHGNLGNSGSHGVQGYSDGSPITDGSYSAIPENPAPSVHAEGSPLFVMVTDFAKGSIHGLARLGQNLFLRLMLIYAGLSLLAASIIYLSR